MTIDMLTTGFIVFVFLFLLLLISMVVFFCEISKAPPTGGTPYTLPNGMRISRAFHRAAGRAGGHPSPAAAPNVPPPPPHTPHPIHTRHADWQASETDFLFKEIWGDENAYGEASAEGGGSPLIFRPGALILDAGANIGMFSLFAAAQCGGHARVVSFEPIPTTFSVLAANARAATAGEFDAVLRAGGGSGGAGGAEGRLVMEPQNVGLSSAPADTHFEHHPHFTVWSTQDPVFAEARLTRITEDMPRALDSSDSAFMRNCFPRWLARLLAGLLLRRKLGVTERVPVKLVTLSSVIDRLALGPVIDFLKVDVEGAEVEVLKGIREEHWERIQQVALEVENFAAKDTVVGMLRAKGFNTHWFASERKRNPDVLSEVRKKMGAGEGGFFLHLLTTLPPFAPPLLPGVNGLRHTRRVREKVRRRWEG
jgi:FkbM family methyltransferase